MTSDNHGMEASDSNSAGDNRKKHLIHVEGVIGKKSLYMLPKKRPRKLRTKNLKTFHWTTKYKCISKHSFWFETNAFGIYQAFKLM